MKTVGIPGLERAMVMGNISVSAERILGLESGRDRIRRMRRIGSAPLEELRIDSIARKLRSQNSMEVMNGFGILQGIRCNEDFVGWGERRGYALHSLFTYVTLMSIMDRDGMLEGAIMDGVARISGNAGYLSKVLAGSGMHVRYQDSTNDEMTPCGTHSLLALRGRVGEVNNEVALAYIAVLSVYPEDRMAAVERIRVKKVLAAVKHDSRDAEIRERAGEKLQEKGGAIRAVKEFVDGAWDRFCVLVDDLTS